MKNRDRIIKFCSDLNLGIIKIEYFRDKEASYYSDSDCSYYEVKLRLPFNYKEKFWSDIGWPKIDGRLNVMFSHIEARIEHILNKNLTH